MKVSYWQCLALALVCELALAHAIEQLVEQVEPTAVVLLGTREDTGARVQSSGCSVHPDGFILTTAHQMVGARDLEAVYADGRRSPLRLVALDEERELALLQAETAAGMHAPIGNAESLRGGTPLLSIATPANLSFSAVRGMVSSMNRTYNSYWVFQAELPAAPGSSGGPVFDRYGNLVGIIIGKMTEPDAFTIVNPINNAYALLLEHGILATPPGPDEALLAPAPDASPVQRDALEAYNAGVRAPDPAAKVRAYARAVELMPDFYEAWFNRGVAYTELEDWAEAEAAYLRANTLRPEALEARRNLGRLFLRTARIEAALEVFREAAELASEEPQSHNDLGEALRQAGKPEKAVPAFERALALRPGYPQAQYNLALALLEAGETERAAREFAAYLAQNPAGAERAEIEALLDGLIENSGAAEAPPSREGVEP